MKRIAIAVLGALCLGLPATPALAQDAASIWAGIGTQEQLDRGKVLYSGICAKCHGPNGNGAGEPDQPESPAIARATFLTKWDATTLDGLFEYIRTEMPPDNPQSRSDQEYVDAMVYMLSLSTVPLGTAELPPDPAALAGYFIEPKPAP